LPGSGRGGRRRIVWDDEPVDLTADEARVDNTPTPGSAFGDGRKARAAPVREFLCDVLKVGLALQKIVVERGAEKGFSLQQLGRARKTIGAVAFKRRGEGPYRNGSGACWNMCPRMPRSMRTARLCKPSCLPLQMPGRAQCPQLDQVPHQ
jgi:hypothetical protein